MHVVEMPRDTGIEHPAIVVLNGMNRAYYLLVFFLLVCLDYVGLSKIIIYGIELLA